MEESILDDMPTGQAYRIKSITIATFFAGFPAAGYMLYKNFKLFGEDYKAKIALIGSIVAFVLLLILASLPGSEKIPNLVWSAFCTILTHYVASRLQGETLSNHEMKGGEVFSAGKVTGMVLISFLMMAGLFLGMYAIAEYVAAE